MPFRWHVFSGRRVAPGLHKSDLATQKLLIELECSLALSVETKIWIRSHVALRCFRVSLRPPESWRNRRFWFSTDKSNRGTQDRQVKDIFFIFTPRRKPVALLRHLPS